MNKELKSPKYTKNKDKLNSHLSKKTKDKAKSRPNKAVERAKSTENFIFSSLGIIGALIIIVGLIIFNSSRIDNIETPSHILEINNEKISIEQIEENVLQNPDMDSILSNYINDTILLNKAKEEGYTTTNEEVENYISALAVQSGGSLEDLKEALEMVNTTYENFKEYIKKAITISKLIEDKIKPNIEVSQLDAKEFYDLNTYMFQEPKSYNVSHILVTKKEDAQNILEEAKNTNNFEELVKKYKNESLEAVNFIYYDGNVVQPFQDAVDSVEQGLYDGLVESNYSTFAGYHIVYVYEKIDAKNIQYEDVEEDIINFLQNEKSSIQLNNYVEKLIKESSIWLNYQELDKLTLEYKNLDKIYNLKNKKVCLNEDNDIIYFSNKEEYDKTIPFYDLSNKATAQIFTECFSNDINISNVKLPVMVCLKNDVIIEGGNLNQIESVCN